MGSVKELLLRSADAGPRGFRDRRLHKDRIPARTLAGLRDRGVPIYGFTAVPHVFRQLLLPWGVDPFLMELSGDPDDPSGRATQKLRDRGRCQSGQWLAVITNVLASGSAIDTIQLRQVP